MLKPLKDIFGEQLFENPANDKFAWVGADEASVMILQDFRWNRDCITWKDLLLLLEGETVKLPAPKNIYTNDVIINSDVAIFATSKCEVTYRGPYNMHDPQEDAMMAARWKVFQFRYQFKEEQQKHKAHALDVFVNLY